LARRLAENDWLGRDGVAYVFDTAMALPLVGAPQEVVFAVVEALRKGRACFPVTRPGHWSQVLGAHHLKCALWLDQAGEPAFAGELADRLVDTCFDGRRFRIHEDSEQTYLHSHCYALEGLLGLGSHDDVIEAGADWLSAVQSPDGGFPAWFGWSSDSGSSKLAFAGRTSDVVAQALRIWAAVDSERFEQPMSLALNRLASLQDPGTGGIAYHDTCLDQTSWVAAFAVQACRWAQQPPDRDELSWVL
jgi:hypothetical protein